MNLDINLKADSMYTKLTITPTRGIELMKKASSICAIFSARRHPYISTLIDIGYAGATDEEKKEFERDYGNKDQEYYKEKLNLFKEIAEICDNLEEYTLLMPMAVKAFETSFANSILINSVREVLKEQEEEEKNKDKEEE